MKNIAFIHYSSPPVIGGVEFVMEAQVRFLASRGHKIKVISGKGKRFLPEMDFTCIPEVYSLNQVNTKVQEELKERKTDSFLSLKSYLREKLEEELKGFDVVIAHNFFTMPFNMALTAACHELAMEKEFIVWIHDSPYFDPSYSDFLDSIDQESHPWNLLRRALPETTYVALTEARRKKAIELLGIPKEKIKIVPNGIDIFRLLNLCDELRKIAEYYSLWEKGWIGIFPARLISRKNVELAIKIIAEMKRQGTDSILIITGPPDAHREGEEYFYCLKNLVEEKKVEDRIVFLAKYPSGDGYFKVGFNLLRSLYLISDFLLITSFQEGFGIPLLEGAIFKLPVFCSDIPPLREIGKEGVYFFSLKESPEKIAQRIIKILKTLKPLNLFHKVLRTYDWERVLKTHLIPLIRE